MIRRRATQAGLPASTSCHTIRATDLELQGYEQRSYSLSARYWVDDRDSPLPRFERQVARSENVAVLPGKGPTTVRLVLGEPVRLGDER